MPSTLNGLDIVLVGGSGGLGSPAAEMLINDGAKLIVSYCRNKERNSPKSSKASRSFRPSSRLCRTFRRFLVIWLIRHSRGSLLSSVATPRVSVLGFSSACSAFQFLENPRLCRRMIRGFALLRCSAI